MIYPTLALLGVFTSTVNAHFRLQYPEPRGAFVADLEPNFCGGYTDAVANRSQFPLSGGFFSVKTGHPDWTAAVLISTAQNPRSFDNFSVNGEQQLALPYAKEKDAGTFCIPLDLAAANITGVEDGANVTIQIIFAGGDGNLYQCADLTLSSNFTIPDNVICANETTSDHHGGDPADNAPADKSGSLGMSQQMSGFSALILGVVGVALSIL